MAAFNPSLHPRVPSGAGGGEFTAKGSAPAPSKKPGKNGGRYTKAQMADLQSLQKQHNAGAKLTKAQAHALHTAHQLHMQHVAAAKGKAKAKAAPKAKRAAKKK